jgi:hypothetical protein
MFREPQIAILSSLSVEPGRAPAALFESLTLDSCGCLIPDSGAGSFAPGAYVMLPDDPKSDRRLSIGCMDRGGRFHRRRRRFAGFCIGRKSEKALW